MYKRQTQACRALKEEGLEVVLVNSNPATIMTDLDIADKVYLEPLTAEVLKTIIRRERPDSLLPTLGGQTGLNLGMELAECGFLDEMGVKLLGTTMETIYRAEDREGFKTTMEQIGEPCIESVSYTHLYTRTEAGRRQLLRCRRNSYINENEQYITGKRSVDSSWQ